MQAADVNQTMNPLYNRPAVRRAITALHARAKWMMSELHCLTREDGQGLTEYALVLALIAVISIAALTLLGGKVTDALSVVGNSLSR